MKESIREYEMLRQEILQYLEEYQTVRNMMYAITAAILGYALTAENPIVYIFLVPLFVILPSYIIFIDYWVSVIRIGTYLRAFHEDRPEYPFKWERRLQKLKEKKFGDKPRGNHQVFPYIGFSMACIFLYFSQLELKMEYTVEVAVGIIAVCFCIIVFVNCRTVGYEEYEKLWRKIQIGEEMEECKKLPANDSRSSDSKKV